MNTLFIGQKIIRLQSVDSTNLRLAELASKENLPEGTTVVAYEQRHGRGQRGTVWHSEAGKNLTCSILLFPKFLRATQQFELNQAVAMAVRDCVSVLLSGTETIKIKWPNDIYIGEKKVAGILLENTISNHCIVQCIAGIGINVNQKTFPDTLPNPVSLSQIRGKDFSLQKCLEELCRCIEKRYLQLSRGHSFSADYLKHLYRFKEWANYRYKNQIVKAKITGITKTGKLMLHTERGENAEYNFQEIEFC